MEPAFHKMATSNRSGKTLKIILAVTLGLIGAASVDRWPNHAAFVQIILYSAIIFLPLLFFFWSDRHHPRFWLGVGLIILFHSILIWWLYSSFPFRTILIILPILFIEGSALAMVMIKMLGDSHNSRGA